jgi:hypothetical protein
MGGVCEIGCLVGQTGGPNYSRLQQACPIHLKVAVRQQLALRIGVLPYL